MLPRAVTKGPAADSALPIRASAPAKGFPTKADITMPFRTFSFPRQPCPSDFKEIRYTLSRN